MTGRSMPLPGTPLFLRPGEWQLNPGTPAHTSHEIRIVSVRDSHDPAYAWVYGHGPECSWESADCTAPYCWDVLVSVDVLAATTTGERP
ncbi:hypothetical protein V6V47_11730 [Micromonospora sp. CPCC 205539]|uniref:hypothetical protein n=1 Tax=Micromonospora sp. CPCC 205539 TaxID=3122408 RepID=UPI002FEF6E88